MLSHKKLVLVFLLILSIAMVTAMAALRGQTQNSSPSENRSAYKEEPTPIQEGLMTEKQKAHSKLFRQDGASTLPSQAAQQSGEINVELETPFVINLHKDTSSSLPFIQFTVCNADAVVVGTLKSKVSQLTEDKTFIFTDYEVAVEEIIKNNNKAAIQPNSGITVTRQGGAVQSNGRIFRAKRADFKPFTIGNRYLLFLRFLPATGSYLAYPNGSFELQGDHVVAFGDMPDSEPRNPLDFLNETRSAVNNSRCSEILNNQGVRQ